MVTESEIEQFAKTIERIEDGIECRCCCEKFIPLDKDDFFCKKCLRKLHNELIKKMEDHCRHVDESLWSFRDMKTDLGRYREIQMPRKKQCCKDLVQP